MVTVFVCHASSDAATARSLVGGLEARGISCWMAPRDIMPGRDYAESILEGLAGAGAVVLIVSEHANDSRHVRREIERAVNTGLPIYPFRIDDVHLSPTLDYFVGTAQWLDATAGVDDRSLDALAAVLAPMVNVTPGPRPAADRLTPNPRDVAGSEGRPSNTRRHAPGIAVGVGLTVVVGVVMAVALVAGGNDTQRQGDATTDAPPSSPTTPAQPVSVKRVSTRFPVGVLRGGARFDRNWVLGGDNGSRFKGTLTFYNPTSRTIDTHHEEFVPHSLAVSPSDVRLRPVAGNPRVQWLEGLPMFRIDMSLRPNAEATLVYEVDVPPRGATTERLRDWREDFVAARGERLRQRNGG